MNGAINFSVVMEMQASDMKGALSELLVHGGLGDDAAALEALLRREGQGSTAIGGSVAVPHAKVPGITSSSVIIGISHRGLDYSGTPVSIIMMILLPESETSSDVELLSRLVSAVSTEEGRSAVLSAGSVAEVEEVFLS